MAFLAIAGNAVWGQNDPTPVHGSLENPIDIGNQTEAYEIDGDGTWYITTSHQQNTHGIKVKGDIASYRDKVTIYLVNTNFKVGGSAIVVPENAVSYADLTLVLVGENKIISDGTAAAIKIGSNNMGSNATLTISEKSTGTLNIEMAENGKEEMVAIGNTGAIGDMCISGTITVKGGTIITNGYLGKMDTRGFYLQNNAVLVAQGVEGASYNDLRSGGVFFEGKSKTGTLYTDFTLNSPLPEGYIINLNGHNLSLGNGISINTNQVDNSKGGTINAYKVSYDINKPEDLTSTNPSSFPSKYVGKNTPIAEEYESLTPADAYYSWGWLDSDSKQIVTTSPSEDPSNGDKMDLKGVWVVKNYTVEVEKNSEVSVPLVVPSEANVSITSPSKDWTVDNSKKTISGKIGEENVTLEVTIDDNKTATLTFKVKESEEPEPEEPIDISTGDYKIDLSYLEAANLTYDTKDHKSEILSYIQVCQSDGVEPVAIDSKYYTVTITLDGNVANEIIDADEYTITVEGKEDKGYTGKLTETFKVNPATLTIHAIGISCELNGTPDYSNVTFKCEPYDGDVVVASWEGETPTGTDKVNTAEAGTYTVTYSKDNIELNGDDAKNYILNKDVECTITVMGEQGGDEDKTDINDVEMFIKYHEKIFVYNGGEQDPTYLVVVKDKDGDPEYKEDVDYTVSILDAEGEPAEFKNAGEYTLVVIPTTTGALTGEAVTLSDKLTIYPREVKVVARDITYTIGDEEGMDMKDLFSFAKSEEEHKGLVASDEGALAVTANPLSLKDYTVPGTYTITYQNVELIGSAANNYKLGEEVTGNVIVTKELSGDEEL